jgi:hypothetical protein
MKILRLLTVVLLSVAVFYACKKDDSTKKDDGLSTQVHNMVPDSIINEMKTLGLPLYGGTTPPNLQNIYLATPFILKSSNRAGDYAGKSFADYYVKFYGQDNTALSIMVDYYNGGEKGTGLGGFISGVGNTFTVFAKVHSTYLGDQADFVHVISGTLISGAIKDLYFANFMLDNYGNPHGYWIDEGEGRVIYDSDGNSPVSSTMPTLLLEKSASAATIGSMLK